MPAEKSVGEIGCPFCDGDNPACECGGTGELLVHRCPRATTTQRERDLLAAVLMAQNGVLPEAGGWQDQPRSFVEIYPLLAAELSFWRGKHEERARRAAAQK